MVSLHDGTTGQITYFNNRDLASVYINTSTHLGTKIAQEGGSYLNPNILFLSIQGLQHTRCLELVDGIYSDDYKAVLFC